MARTQAVHRGKRRHMMRSKSRMPLTAELRAAAPYKYCAQAPTAPSQPSLASHHHTSQPHTPLLSFLLKKARDT
jgi:hypothetical protein